MGLLWRESHRHDLRKSVTAGCTSGSGGPQSIDSGILESLSLSRKLAWTHRSAQNHIKRLLVEALVPRSTFSLPGSRYSHRSRWLSQCCYWSVRASTTTTSELLCSACHSFHSHVLSSSSVLPCTPALECAIKPTWSSSSHEQHISVTLNFSRRRIVSLRTLLVQIHWVYLALLSCDVSNVVSASRVVCQPTRFLPTV